MKKKDKKKKGSFLFTTVEIVKLYFSDLRVFLMDKSIFDPENCYCSILKLYVYIVKQTKKEIQFINLLWLCSTEMSLEVLFSFFW